METILLNNLSKTYPGGKEALRHMSLSLGTGEVFGFLGPNGAGKTTTVKLLNGILTPTEGFCQVLGTDPAKNPEKAHGLTGVVTEHAQMYNHLTGLDNLLFYASVFNIPAQEGKKRALALLERLGLAQARNQKLASYSTGMRQRLSLARSLIHRPKVLFLDEPTSGLDPESAQNVNSLIRDLAREEGTTVFLCTHQLRYAQELCTRYGLIEEGRLLALGTLEELRARVCQGALLKIRASHMPNSCLSLYPSLHSTNGWDYEMQIASEEEIPQILRQIVENGGELYSAETKFPSLEDIYFTLTAKEERT